MRYGTRSALIMITAGMLLGSGAALAASNACKADLTGDLVVNFADLAKRKSVNRPGFSGDRIDPRGWPLARPGRRGPRPGP